jgi:zinc/manganese transport system ATP-binding protein
MNQMPASHDSAVSLVHVSIRLGGMLIQNEMTFRLSPGEFVAILGPNGSGKSTLLKMLLGLLRASEGEVMVLGKVPRTGNQQIGYLPQFLNLDSMNTLRARDIVGFGLDGHRWGIGLLSRDREKKLDRILEEVDALDFSRAAFDELSGGERQRLLLAQALISDPQLLLLDEPLASLDIAHSQEVITLVTRICRSRRITVLLVTHDVNPLLPDIDKVLYLANGKSALGRPEEVITGDALSRLYGSHVEVVSAQGRRFVIGAEV